MKKQRNDERSQKDKKHDKALDMTFPASDSLAQGKATSTERPKRPADRKAPQITKEQIEQAARGEGHKHEEPRRGRRTR